MTSNPPSFPPVSRSANPFEVFGRWFADAQAAGLKYPNAMTLATVDAEGTPDARVVLLKGWDARGFVFYTNLQSAKGTQLATHATAALCFYWESLDRQIRIRGKAERVSDAEADEYYATRPRMSRIGAWASDQSRPMSDRGEFERRLAVFDAKFPGENVPRPPHWSGTRIIPQEFEFWCEREFRLHERTRFVRRADGSWDGAVLFP